MNDAYPSPPRLVGPARTPDATPRILPVRRGRRVKRLRGGTDLLQTRDRWSLLGLDGEEMLAQRFLRRREHLRQSRGERAGVGIGLQLHQIIAQHLLGLGRRL